MPQSCILAHGREDTQVPAANMQPVVQRSWRPASTGLKRSWADRAGNARHKQASRGALRKTPHTMHRCRRVQDHTVPARRSDLSEGSRAAGLALTIQIVALQQRRHETSRDRIHEAEVRTMEGASPVRLLATG